MKVKVLGVGYKIRSRKKKGVPCLMGAEKEEA